MTVCKFIFYFYYFENMMKWLRKRRDKILSICTKYSIVTVVLEGMTGKTKSQSPPHLQVPFTYFLVVTTYQRLIIWESGQHQFIGLYTERFYSVEWENVLLTLITLWSFCYLSYIIYFIVFGCIHLSIHNILKIKECM